MVFRRLREYGKFLKSLFNTNVHLLWGMWKLTRLPQPAITIFGGSRIPLDSLHAKKATELAKLLASDGFSIITGGGPGIMEAANLGAIEHLRECHLGGDCKSMLISAGIGLIRLNKEKANPYVQQNIVMEHFFSRKWLLVRYAVGFVIFPGGFGTLDELFEVITLVQCNRMAKVPIILIDKSYWRPLTDFIEHRALPYHLIKEEDKDIFTITDSVEEAFSIIREYCKSQVQSVYYNGDNRENPAEPQNGHNEKK